MAENSPVPTSPAELDDIPRRWASAWPELDTNGLPLIARLTTLARRTAEFHDHCLRQHGVDHAEYATLSMLRLQGPSGGALTPGELSAVLHQTTAGTSKTINRLADRGLVFRSPHPQSGRKTLVQLTPEGFELAEQVGREEARGRALVMGQVADPEGVHAALDLLIAALDRTSQQMSREPGRVKQ